MIIAAFIPVKIHVQSADLEVVTLSYFFFFYYLCRSLASVKVNKVRYVVWSSDMAYVSLLGKHGKSKLEIHLIDVALLKGHVVCRFCLRQHMIDSSILCINNICCLLVVFQNVEISR